MLKAVRFDDNEHKKLLEFIKNYYDSKGRLNESEGIRFLMQLGLETLTKSKEENQSIDTESLKKELYSELLQQVNNQTFNLLLEKLDKLQPIYIHNNNLENITVNEVETKEIKQRTIKKNPITPINSSTLLSNLINNSNK